MMLGTLISTTTSSTRTAVIDAPSMIRNSLVLIRMSSRAVAVTTTRQTISSVYCAPDDVRLASPVADRNCIRYWAKPVNRNGPEHTIISSVIQPVTKPTVVPRPFGTRLYNAPEEKCDPATRAMHTATASTPTLAITTVSHVPWPASLKTSAISDTAPMEGPMPAMDWPSTGRSPSTLVRSPRSSVLVGCCVPTALCVMPTPLSRLHGVSATKRSEKSISGKITAPGQAVNGLIEPM